jgi:hypothetical protein
MASPWHERRKTDVRAWVDGEQVAEFGLPVEDATIGTVGLAGGCGAFNTMPDAGIEYDHLVVTASHEQE